MTDTAYDGISKDWLSWMADYSAAAESFILEDPVSVSSDEERELVSLKLALYARALTLFEGARLLIEHDRQLDFRIHSRGIIEAAMYLIALDRDPSFVEKMKDDDFKSRHARASLHLNSVDLNTSDEVHQLLVAFVKQGPQGAKMINTATLLEGSGFDRLYRSYRDISGDAAHTSVSALNRHYVEEPDSGLAVLMVHPKLSGLDIYMTVAEIGNAMSIATLILMKVKQKTDLWEEFQTLVHRYKELTRRDREGLSGMTALT